MLRDPIFAKDGMWNAVKNSVYTHKLDKIETGLYEIGHFNFEYDIGEDIIQYPLFTKNLYSYGVCDDIENFKNVYGKIIKMKSRQFCVSFTKIEKKTQPPRDGWRWEKWGEYVGTKTITSDYIYHEKEIESVYCFHVYEFKRKVR